MLREHHSFFLPNLLSFTNGNTYLGSFLGLRFRVKPAEQERDGEKRAVLECLCWYGEYCLEESEVVAEEVFPLDEQGREQVVDWLEAQWQAMPKPEGAQAEA
ncbi:MAG: hypothetical protein IJ751_08435 [Oscillospiraceae bacterium]|nr:hypothetical protein [Oscillospiraceae bacterium]